MSDIDDDEEDEDHLADRVLLQIWQAWRREQTREVAEAEAVAAMGSDPMFGGVALRDLEREDQEWRRRRPLLFRKRPSGGE